MCCFFFSFQDVHARFLIRKVQKRTKIGDLSWIDCQEWPKLTKFWSEKSKNGRKLVICHELIAKNGQNLRNSDQKCPKMDENWWYVMNWLLPQSKNGQKLWIFVYCPIQVTWLFSNLNLHKVRLTWVRLG